MKKLLSLLLVLAMLAPAMIACANDDPPADTTEPAASVSDTESDTTTDTDISERTPNLPDVSYDGAEYKVLAAAQQWERFWIAKEEETDGDIVAQAVYDRNAAVETKYDIILNYEIFNGYTAGKTQVSNALQDSVSGSAVYDLMTGTIGYHTPLLLQNMYADISQPEYKYIDLTQPWWYQFMNDELSLLGSNFLIAGSAGMFSLATADVAFFNKEITANNDALDDPYELVKNNKWTIDKMLEMCEIALTDVNSDNLYDTQNDVIGFLSTWDYSGLSTKSLDYQPVVRGDDGIQVFEGVTDKIVDINTIYYNLFQSDYYLDAYKVAPSNTYDEMFKIFANGHSLFMVHRVESAESAHLRNMPDYGIVPMPKYDTDQENYLTAALPDVMMIPSYVNDEEFSSVIAEALTYESWKNLRTTYLEAALQEKFSRDPDTAKMLDIIMNNLVADFGNSYSQCGITSLPLNLGKNENYASWAAQTLPKGEVKLLELLEKVQEIQKANAGQ